MSEDKKRTGGRTGGTEARRQTISELFPFETTSGIYRTIIEQSPVGISVRDRNGNLILCNTKWLQIWNISHERETALLNSRNETLRFDETDKYLAENTRLVEDVYENGGELLLSGIHVPRLNKWLDQHFYALKNQHGEVESVVILTQDVTDRVLVRGVEKELIAERERFYALVSNLPVSVGSFDLQVKELIFANPAMLGMFCVDSKEAFCSLPFRNRLGGLVDWNDLIEDLESNGTVENHEIELVRSDGSHFLASISAHLTRDESGKSTTIDGIVRDVSRLKALGEELVKARTLESIGVLAGGIAHDFNNILTTVLGNISLAKLDLSNTEWVEDKLEYAEKASLKGTEITNRLLTFARGGAPVCRAEDVCRLFRESVSGFFVLPGNIRIKVECRDDLSSVFVDESQIKVAVHNVLQNAAEAMPDGGEIKITFENTILEEENVFRLQPGGYVKAMVTDTGAGISGDVLDRVFDPYFSTKPGAGGFGLAVVFSVVSRHGGTVTVDSRPGSGTRVALYLPAVKSRDLGISGKGSRAANSAEHPKLLVMDDDPFVRKMMSRVLGRNGYNVDESGDGLEAIEMYKAALGRGEPYRLIILDLTVPGGVGGAKVLKAIHRFDPAVKAIVVSGYSDDDVLTNYEAYGFVGMITKPFPIEKLLDTVRRAVGTIDKKPSN